VPADGAPRDASLEARLERARPDELDATVVALALETPGAQHGALFLWDPAAHALVLAHHVVGGVTVTLPQKIVPGQGRAGIASWVYEHDRPYLCIDAAEDPYYTRYLLDVGTIAAAPVRHQGRPIGVLTIAALAPHALDDRDVARLGALADVAAPFLRRAQLDRQSREQTGRPFLIRGLSPAWREVERRIDLAAPTRAPILVRGESGSGKDLVARAIHANSARADKPYVTVNCAAIPDTLLESILFGHVKGAFTGASFQKVGEFQKADGGTLFLDEIGELPVLLQAKVLRAIEQGEVQPLGSNQAPSIVDVRLVCATNRDLEGMARQGTFRGDLYYRLSVMPLELPPLRAYKDNLEVLATVFLEQAAAQHGKPAPRLGAAVLERLRAYDFPGNVRELRNAVEHALILCTGDELAPRDLPRALLGPADVEPAIDTAVGVPAARAPAHAAGEWLPLRAAREQWLEPLERAYLVELLDACGGNVRKAARLADVNPVTFYRLLRQRRVEVRRTATPIG
jgi:two-component system response regulator HydG